MPSIICCVIVGGGAESLLGVVRFVGGIEIRNCKILTRSIRVKVHLNSHIFHNRAKYFYCTVVRGDN